MEIAQLLLDAVNESGAQSAIAVKATATWDVDLTIGGPPPPSGGR